MAQRISRAKRTVSGVRLARPSEERRRLGEEPFAFVPLSFKPSMTPGWDGRDNYADYWLYLFARLQPGATVTDTVAYISDLTVTEDSGSTSLGLGAVAYGPGGGADESGQVLAVKVDAARRRFNQAQDQPGQRRLAATAFANDAQYFATFSGNGGVTFFPNFQVSAGTSNGIASGSAAMW